MAMRLMELFARREEKIFRHGGGQVPLADESLGAANLRICFGESSTGVGDGDQDAAAAREKPMATSS
ncbi:hypothetical protein B7463_g10865, partial [Scytalidium lignicola]